MRRSTTRHERDNVGVCFNVAPRRGHVTDRLEHHVTDRPTSTPNRPPTRPKFHASVTPCRTTVDRRSVDRSNARASRVPRRRCDVAIPSHDAMSTSTNGEPSWFGDFASRARVLANVVNDALDAVDAAVDRAVDEFASTTTNETNETEDAKDTNGERTLAIGSTTNAMRKRGDDDDDDDGDGDGDGDTDEEQETRENERASRFARERRRRAKDDGRTTTSEFTHDDVEALRQALAIARAEAASANARAKGVKTEDDAERTNGKKKKKEDDEDAERESREGTSDEMAILRAQVEEAKAQRENAERAAGRAAASAAKAEGVARDAERARAKAEAELAERVRRDSEKEARERVAEAEDKKRERAELASKRDSAKLALAEKAAEEARALAEKATRENEERNRRFAHVQAQFQAREKQLGEKIESMEVELKTLRANAEEAARMKADAEAIVAEAREETDETKAALTALTERSERAERALEIVEAEANEARTRLTVLEEMATLRKSAPERRAPPPTEPVSTQTEPLPEPSKPPPESTFDDSAIRKRLAALIDRLGASAPSASAPANKDSGSIWGMLGMVAADDERDAGSSSQRKDITVDALFDRVEALLGKRSARAARDAAEDVKDKDKDKEIEALRVELNSLKVEIGERSTVSLAAVNRRAQEAEVAAAEAKKRLADVEKANRELSWQISMLTENDEKQLRPELASSGWLARATGAVTGCTAPRRQRSVLL